ncbi:hypothetical protein [Massilia pseudoviolaceinigra]|uniref:hypothetical protein n=1 Tax=Massilia pseudoviolaceinigra TaxID=3057165 RepID=UPI002796CFD8|nr:hypothetical protein [Massilia sp. CCM 9206]MDQ1921518.1 hypothetical protein [Massilia sp. CCM 9206]
MLTRSQIEELNALLVRVDEDEDEEDDDDWFALEFSEPDSAEDIAALEGIIGFGIPDALKALYQQCGAFGHASYGLSWQTIKVRSASRMLERLRAGGDATPAMGLLNYIHDSWGGRTELEVIDSELAKIVNENYVVFGERIISDDVYDYWYFDRNGLFGCLHFDQDQGGHNIWKLETLGNIVPPEVPALSREERRAQTLLEVAIFSGDEDIFPGKELDELITQQFEACAQSLAHG